MLGISSDGVSRLSRSMKIQTNFEINPFLQDEYTKFPNSEVSYSQDHTHIGTKLRNRLTKPSILLPLGNRQISVAHLKMLVLNVPKDIHGIVLNDISPDDKQNFASLEKIMMSRVTEALQKFIIDSEATVAYIKLCNFVTSSFLDRKLNPLDRIFRIWYSVFFIRGWKKWLDANGYNSDKNFISSNASDCIEINANCLLGLIIKLREQDKASFFQTTFFDSQECERFFRQMRSMTTMSYTMINFPLHGLLNLVQRVELQYDIIYNKLMDKGIVFPRINIHEKTIEDTAPTFNMPSNEELVDTIKKARIEAIHEISKFGISINEIDVERCEMKRRVISAKEIATEDDDDDVDASDEEVDSDLFSSIFYNRTEPINLPTHEPTSEADNHNQYIMICDQDGSEKLVRKSSLVWLLSDPVKKLSNDRLKRVQTTQSEKKEPNAKRTRNNTSSSNSEFYKKYDETVLQIGKWGIFLLDSALQKIPEFFEPYLKFCSWLLDSIVVGSILGFKYSLGKTEKDKQYRLDSALITDDTRIKKVDVLATWYKVNANGVLYQVEGKNSFYIDSHNYIDSIEANLVEKNVEENFVKIDIKYIEEKLQKITIVQI